MDDFQRRLLDVTQSSTWLAAFARNTPDVLAMDPFVYNGNVLAVAGGASAEFIIPINSDSDFAMVYMSGQQIGAGTATVQFTDTGSNKTFYNQPTLFPMVLGSAGFPFLLPSPRLVAPNTNIKVDVTNLSVATPMDFWVSLAGARIYYKGASNQGN